VNSTITCIATSFFILAHGTVKIKQTPPKAPYTMVEGPGGGPKAKNKKFRNIFLLICHPRKNFPE
jgi:hypothetical protein